MSNLIYRGKKLTHVDDITHVIDDEGKTKCDLFNSEGALLVTKGKHVPDKIHHIALYTYQNDYMTIKSLADDTTQLSDSKQHQILQHERKRSEAVRILQQTIGEKTVSRYQESVDAVDDMFDGNDLNEHKVKNAKDIIDETITSDRPALFQCISTLRTADSYTYDHSFSVYILLVQALDNFKKYSNRDVFWDMFKEHYNKVDFSPAGLRKYGLGGLLHDYGKTLVPDKVLLKPGKLTEEEFAIMKKHPGLGVEQLHKLHIDEPQILEIVGNHHPQYPYYPERGQTPIVQIANIIDIYDACRSPRPYKEGFSFEEVIEILEKERHHWGWDRFIYNVVVYDTITPMEDARKVS